MGHYHSKRYIRNAVCRRSFAHYLSRLGYYSLNLGEVFLTQRRHRLVVWQIVSKIWHCICNDCSCWVPHYFKIHLGCFLQIYSNALTRNARVLKWQNHAKGNGNSMKGFKRNNQLLSLCGLNCGLCPMMINKYCPGCGGGEGNQSCKIARCSMEHGTTDYCFQCADYPSEKCNHIDDFDSFITHYNQKANLEKASHIGINNYNKEQKEKIRILNFLLSNYNDGRKKILFFVAVNLMDLNDLRELLAQIEHCPELVGLTLKDQSSFVAQRIKKIADNRGIKLSLRKKKKCDDFSR